MGQDFRVRVMLTLSDREEISRGLAEGLLYKKIGARIGRDPSIVSCEVGRRTVTASSIRRRPPTRRHVQAGNAEPVCGRAVERSTGLRSVVTGLRCEG